MRYVSDSGETDNKPSESDVQMTDSGETDK